MQRKKHWRRRRCSYCRDKFWVRVCYTLRFNGGKFCSAACKYNAWRGSKRKHRCLNGHIRSLSNLSNGSCKVCARVAAERYYKKHTEDRRRYRNNSTARVKLEVLTHYSPRKVLRCCWRNCRISDIDMLSLDHKMTMVSNTAQNKAAGTAEQASTHGSNTKASQKDSKRSAEVIN